MPATKTCKATKRDRVGFEFKCQLEAHTGARHSDPERGTWYEPNKSRKGEGSWFQRSSDGLWVGQISLKNTLDGKRHRPTVVATSEAEIKRKLRELKDESARHRGVMPKGSVTLERWMDYYWEQIAIRKIRPGTARGYKSKVGYIVDAIGTVKIDKLTPDHIRKLHAYMRAKGLSASTATQTHSILANALRYAEQDNRVFRNVAAITDKPKKKRTTELTVLSGAEGIRVLASAKDDARLGSRIAAALLTGARQGELLGLEIDRVSDVLDLSWQLVRVAWEHGCGESTGTETVIVKATGKERERLTWPCGHPRGTDCPRRRIEHADDWEHRHLTGGLYLARPKSTAGWRIVPLVDPLKSIIERRIEQSLLEPNPFNLVWTAEQKHARGGRRELLPLDGMPIDPRVDSSAWHAVLNAAGVTDVRLHDARHTNVDLLYEAGVPEVIIQEIVGHSAVSMSRSYKSRGNREQLTAAMNALSALMSVEKPPQSE